jgi:hypothetical protein
MKFLSAAPRHITRVVPQGFALGGFGSMGSFGYIWKTDATEMMAALRQPRERYRAF